MNSDDSMLKDELVETLFNHLIDNETTYAKTNTFADF